MLAYRLNTVNKIITLFLVIPLAVSVFSLIACQNSDEPGFGIYLAENGELVLSDKHIKMYYQETHTIELNEAGIEQWNSFMTYSDIPKLADTLYGRDFIIRIDDTEIYGGKFYSGVSSATYPGVVIMDALMKRNKENNTIHINHGYPGPSFGSGTDPRNNKKVLDFFKDRGCLE